MKMAIFSFLCLFVFAAQAEDIQNWVLKCRWDSSNPNTGTSYFLDATFKIKKYVDGGVASTYEFSVRAPKDWSVTNSKGLDLRPTDYGQFIAAHSDINPKSFILSLISNSLVKNNGYRDVRLLIYGSQTGENTYRGFIDLGAVEKSNDIAIAEKSGPKDLICQLSAAN
ncbi:MAG: hypothetical protein WCG27_08755 [Pseudomonadota bacterium]